MEESCGLYRHHYKNAGTVIFCTYCGDRKSLSEVSSLVERLDEMDKRLNSFSPSEQQRKLDSERHKMMNELAANLGKLIGTETRQKSEELVNFMKNNPPVVVPDTIQEEEVVTIDD